MTLFEAIKRIRAQKILLLGLFLLASPMLIILGTIIYCFFPSLRFGNLVSSRIGHLAMDVDAAIQRIERRQSTRKLMLILVADTVVCNEYLLSLWGSVNTASVKVKISKSRWLRLFTKFLKHSRVFSSLHVSVYSNSKFWAAAIRAKSLLIPKPIDYKIFESWSRDHKLNLNRPYILLHNRDNSYLGEKFRYHDFRDFSPNIFQPIIEKYKDRYFFVRLGRVSNESLMPKSECFIDLPFERHDDLIDMLIRRNALFHFGADSGGSTSTLLWRRPLAGINYAPNTYGLFREYDCYSLGIIPKKIVDSRSGKPVGLIEMYERKLHYLSSQSEFESAGVEVISNSSGEVQSFFAECLRKIECAPDPIEASALQEEFWRIVSFYESRSPTSEVVPLNCRIGESFLVSNRYLVER